MNYQRYALGRENPPVSRFRWFEGSPPDRWVVGSSGYCRPDSEFPGRLQERVVRRNEPPFGAGRRVEWWDGDWHPVSSGGEDCAVESALGLMDEWYSDIGDYVPWAVVHPVSVGEADRRGLLVVGEAAGTPPFVFVSSVLEVGEFRPRWNRAAGYAPLSKSVETMRGRLGADDLAAAVAPSGDNADQAWLGEVHVRHGDEIRVWPMDWTGLLDAPSQTAAVRAATGQLRRWLGRWSEDNPAADRVPETVGRLFRFDGGLASNEPLADICAGNRMSPALEVLPYGCFGYWRGSPFEADAAGTVPVGSYPTI